MPYATGKPNSGGAVVSLNIDGKTAAWCDGQLSGDPDVLRSARVAAEVALPVPLHLFAPPVVAGLDTPAGAAAALASYKVGRARIVEAPDEVWDLISVGDGCLDYTEDLRRGV